MTLVRPDLGPNCLQRVISRCQCHASSWERGGSVVECLTLDRRAADSILTGVTALWSLSKTQLHLVITLKVSNSQDPDKARQNDRPDLGSNCLQRVISR